MLNKKDLMLIRKVVKNAVLNADKRHRPDLDGYISDCIYEYVYRKKGLLNLNGNCSHCGTPVTDIVGAPDPMSLWVDTSSPPLCERCWKLYKEKCRKLSRWLRGSIND